MVQLSHPYMTTGKTIALTRQTFVSKVMSLSRFVRAFLPRSKCLLISWLQSPFAVILEPKKIKSVAASTFPPVSLCMKWWNWIRTPAKTLSAYNTRISRCWQFKFISCKYKLVLLSISSLGHLFTWLADRLSAFYWSKQNLGFLHHPHIPSGPHQMAKKPTATCEAWFSVLSTAGIRARCSSRWQQWPDRQLPIPFFCLSLFSFSSFTASTIKFVAFTVTCRAPLQSGPAHLADFISYFAHQPPCFSLNVLCLSSSLGLCMTCNPGQEASPRIVTPLRSVTQTSPP